MPAALDTFFVAFNAMTGDQQKAVARLIICGQEITPEEVAEIHRKNIFAENYRNRDLAAIGG